MVNEIRVSEKASEEFIKLVSLVNDLPAGSVLEYHEVEKQTGVTMDIKGKDKLRRAIIKCDKEYALIAGIGYKLANPNLTMPIMTKRFLSIESRIRRADKAHKALMNFRRSLTPEERRGFDFAGAIFGAIQAAAEDGKRLYGNEIKQIAPSKPIIPD